MKKGLHKSKKCVMIIRAGKPAVIFGPVAQLGERTVRIRKVVGSNPFRSTKKKRQPLVVSSFVRHHRRLNKGDLKCSGEVNSPSARFCFAKCCSPARNAGFGIRQDISRHMDK